MTDAAILPLMQYIVAFTPQFVEPIHAAPLVRIFERIAAGEEVRAVVSMPPRSAKTEILKAGGTWLLRQNPALELVLAGYGQNFIENKSRQMRALAEKAEVEADSCSSRPPSSRPSDRRQRGSTSPGSVPLGTARTPSAP